MKRSTKRKLIRNGTYVVTHANPRKGEARAARRRNPRLLGWNKPVKGVTRGYFLRPGNAGDPWYSITRVGIGYGGFYFDVHRGPERLGQAGSIYLAKQLAEEDAATLVHNASLRDHPRQNPVVRRHKTVGEMRRAGVPDILPGTSTLIYESGRTAPLTGHSGHFLSASTHSTALMRRRQVGDEGEFSVVGRHNDWGERVRANPARVSAATLTARQINALSRDAAQAGDLEMCSTCARALRGSRAAKRAVAAAINAARAQRA